MTMRKQIARAMMERAKRGDLFFDMSMAVRETALDNMLPAFEALADIALDCLTAPPKQEWVDAAIQYATNEPRSCNITGMWESIVRAMIEEEKK